MHHYRHTRVLYYFSILESNALPSSHARGKWITSFSTTAESSSPLPSYTKGKWKPRSESEQRKAMKVISKFVQPPTEESPFRKSGGTVQYWCGPCNRRLASKIVYDRHLKSELHYKRTSHDKEFDDINEIIPAFMKESKPSKSARKHKPSEINKSGTSKKRTRRKLFLKCEVCRSRVNRKMLGKHLISHYHWRKSNITLPEAQRMVLENIYDIVRQSPFQCAGCKFYCNTQNEFLQHWLSTLHTNSVSDLKGFFLCTFCDFQTIENHEMYKHLVSDGHNEVVAVINRSVPIVIRKINPIKCPTCNEQFLLNIQLRRHCEVFKHYYPNPKIDEYSCKLCNKYFRTSVSLTKHQRHKHQKNVFACGLCKMTFNSVIESKAHRSTKEHRHAFLTKKHMPLAQNRIQKKCQYCSVSLIGFIEMKKHLEDKHPEHASR